MLVQRQCGFSGGMKTRGRWLCDVRAARPGHHGAPPWCASSCCSSKCAATSQILARKARAHDVQPRASGLCDGHQRICAHPAFRGRRRMFLPGGRAGREAQPSCGDHIATSGCYRHITDCWSTQSDAPAAIQPRAAPLRPLHTHPAAVKAQESAMHAINRRNAAPARMAHPAAHVCALAPRAHGPSG